MLELMCRPARESDIEKTTVIRRSCGATRAHTANRDPDYVLKMMWAYQEACGIGNPMNRRRTANDYLIPKRGLNNGSA